MKPAAALLVLALAACATVPASGPASQPDLITFESRSWGRVVTGWSIGPTGDGAWWTTRENEGGSAGPVGPYRVAYHEFAAGEAGFAQVANTLAALPYPAPIATDCERFRTDDVYGSVRLTRRATTEEVSWNQGCEDAAYRAVLGPIETADALVAAWGRAAPVTRIERFDGDGRGVGIEYPE